MTYLKIILTLFFSVFMMGKTFALKPLSDSEMANVEAQALMSLSYLDQKNNPNKNIGFYRLGLEADIELNANIKRLQLGCGGLKGSGCDIDIENLSLVGINPINGNYAGTDAKISNPFIEFAIKNPESAALREVVGLRLGALSALGKLGLGSNSDLSTLSDDVGGIHSLSGDINIMITNTVLNNLNIGGLVTTKALIDSYSKNLILNRASTITLDGVSAKTGSLYLGFIPLPGGLTLSNATLKDYPTSGFHEILISQNSEGTIPTSDAGLTFQTEPIQWQKISTGSFQNTVVNQPGWWLSLPRAIISNVSTQQRIDVPLFEAIGGIFGREIIINPLDSGQRGIVNCYGNLKFC